MLQCVLLDDELLALQYLKLLCEQIEGVEVVKAFNNPEKFILEKDTLQFDVCILDIEMPAINGLQIANLLTDKKVIFTTAYKEYAVDAFDLDVIDYITKPVQKDRLEKAIRKVEKLTRETKPTSDFITLNSEKGKSVINTNDVFYITVSEIDSRDKVIYFTDDSHLLIKNSSFEKLQELLPLNRFCRINKREIIAMNCVNYYSHDEIVSKIMVDGKPKNFTIGINFRSSFLAQL
ncbi:response regulator transcription factor [Flavobacterium sp. xlx-214]|uniref:LytR/AlgR family response regulator transcription factor n=1 Tax=unclassified Flavobacterium TaxID=196869 RepID=UPI0013D1A213|nr:MULTISPECIES: response regulator [unclassified Flavobacterium]MBA5793846.1 response regulator transcription factor [Flavobacterium sp. xlx-221]QMI84852.1 response regulator transcription factor [Flavobacterium sp. xlx-214]